MVRFFSLQKKGVGNVQQTPPCTPLGRPSPPWQGALWKASTSQSESDPSPSLTLETELDETQERSRVLFSFGKERQTGMRWVPLTTGCRDFSTHLRTRVCCACALTVSDRDQLFCSPFLRRIISFHVVFSLFCHFALRIIES